MARKSRKNSSITPPIHRYNVGAYLRISAEGDRSIFNQQDMITHYIQQHPELHLHRIYVDNGVSSFVDVRPQFNELMKGAKAQIINCIIVKDFSRFTRDYIEFGDYLEQILPMWGTRFISILEDYDSEGIYGTTDFSAALKGMVNAFYSRDISVKVKSIVRMKQQNGTYIAAKLPYGYTKIESGAKVYVIDMTAAEIVRNIFDMALEGISAFEIAGRLNSAGVSSPKVYAEKSLLNNRLIHWTRGTVMQILRNKAYIGCLVTGKTENLSWKLLTAERKSPNEWIIISGHHEPIVSEETFSEVQKILDERKLRYVWSGQNKALGEYLSKLLYCGHCGRKMKRRTWKGKAYYMCSRSLEAKNACFSKSFSEKSLKSEMLDTIQMHIEKMKQYEEQQAFYENTSAYIQKRKHLKTQLEKLRFEHKQIDDIRLSFVNAMQDGEYTPSDYQVFTKSISVRLSKVLSEIQSIEQQNKDYDQNISSNNMGIQSFLKYDGVEELSDEMFKDLVDRVHCYANKNETVLRNIQGQ